MTDATSTAVNRTLPRRLPNSTYRVREYLTKKEVDRLIDAARKRGRNGARDAAAILLAYRHGLRATELCSLRWSQIDLRHGRLHVNRAKGGQESVHPLHGPELRALRPLQGNSPYVFVTEAGTPVKQDPTDWRSCETAVPNSSAHASAQHWFQARQSGRGYSVAGALSRSPQSTIDGEIYGASA
jgi:integrase